ncbi:MAG TPA: hypothetical protein VIL86_15500 [Tepidisphaeraceae bacterium]
MTRIVGCVIALMMSAEVSLAQSEHDLSVTLQYGPSYAADHWLPVRMQLRNLSGVEISGNVRMPIKDAMGGVIFKAPVYLPEHSRLRKTGYAYFPYDQAAVEQWKAGKGVPKLTVAEWHGNGQEEIARVEVLAQVRENDENTAAPPAMMLALAANGDMPISAPYDTGDLGKYAGTLGGFTMITTTLIADSVARDITGYAPVRFFVFDGSNPDALDLSQRKALMDWLNSGGTIIVPRPIDEGNPTNSWLAPYLPVKIIGSRKAKQLEVSGQAPMPLLEYCDISEAIDNGGEVLLHDDHYVHAASKTVGRGRVVFTSFPINALDRKNSKDPRPARLWKQLLNLDRPSSDLHGTTFEDKREELVQRMMGTPTVPWKTAAAITLGYVVLMLLVQLAIGGVRRPQAFIVGIAVALVISGVLVVLTRMKTNRQQLMGARVAIIDASPMGGSLHEEAVAFVGENDEHFSLKAKSQDVSIRPIRANRQKQATVLLDPFAVPDAGVYALNVERIWQVDGLIPRERRLAISGQFGPEGLKLAMNNEFGGTLRDPLFVWGNERFSLDELKPGQSTALADQRNPRDNFTNTRAVFTSETAKLRKDILQGVFTSSHQATYVTAPSPGPTLVGWADEADVPLLLDTSKPMPMRTQALVRTPVRIDPSPPGTTVKIDGAFNSMNPGESHALFWDPMHHLWLSNVTQGGDMVIGMSAPWEVGTIKPTKATIELDAAAPQQTVTVRRGQCPGGKARYNEMHQVMGNPDGEVVVSWSHLLGKKTVTFDCSGDDFDEHGTLWLYIQVDNAGGAEAQWHFNDLSVSTQAEVIGPRDPQGPFVYDRPGGSGGEDVPEEPKPQPATRPQPATKPGRK